MKGERKKCKTCFSKGNTDGFMSEYDIGMGPSTSRGQTCRVTQTSQKKLVASGTKRPAHIERYDEPFFNKVARITDNRDLPISIPSADGVQGPAVVLRPRCTPTPVQRNDGDNIPDMLFVHKGQLMTLLNVAVQEHSEKSPNCHRLHLDLCDYVPWGACCRARMTCSTCNYKSDRMKLYETIEREGKGAKAAKPNMRLQFGLQDTPIGNERARHLMASLGMRPGSRKGMQKNANKAGEITQSVCQEDLTRHIQDLKNVNKARGLDENSPLIVEFDVRYGGARPTTGYRPGPGAPEGVGLLVENVTTDKSIIGVYVENKLCYKGAWLRRQGQNITCPGHEGCTATISPSELISEQKIANEIGKHLAQVQRVMVSHLTTDSDARGPTGIEEAMKSVDPEWKMTKYKDLMHLGQSQRRQVAKAKFSQQMFGHILRAPMKKKAQEALAADIASRCAISHKRLHAFCRGDIGKIEKCAYRVVDIILDCYSGDHRNCRSTFSFTCKGRNGNTWFIKSPHLKAMRIKYFNPTDEDMYFLKQVIHMTLGRDGLQVTAQRKTTQGCESRNAGLSTSAPRNKRHPRNIKGRIFSAALRLNNGPDKSMKMKMAAGKCDLPVNSTAAAVLKEQSHRHNYSIQYNRRPDVKKHRMELRGRNIQLYHDGVKSRVHQVEYRKFQLDEEILRKKTIRKRCKVALKRYSSKSRKVQNPEYTRAKKRVKEVKGLLRRAEEDSQAKRLASSKAREVRVKRQKKDHAYQKHSE